MKATDLDTIRTQIRDGNHSRGTPEQVAMWRDDLAEARANLAIEDMDLDADDQALFAMMLDESLSPSAMVAVIHSFYLQP